MRRPKAPQKVPVLQPQNGGVCDVEETSATGSRQSSSGRSNRSTRSPQSSSGRSNTTTRSRRSSTRTNKSSPLSSYAESVEEASVEEASVEEAVKPSLYIDNDLEGNTAYTASDDDEDLTKPEILVVVTPRSSPEPESPYLEIIRKRNNEERIRMENSVEYMLEHLSDEQLDSRYIQYIVTCTEESLAKAEEIRDGQRSKKRRRTSNGNRQKFKLIPV